MENPECKYLLDILENTFQNCGPDVLRDDCRLELLNAVEGIDQLFTSLKDRLEQTEQTMEAAYKALFERGYVPDRIHLADPEGAAAEAARTWSEEELKASDGAMFTNEREES